MASIPKQGDSKIFFAETDGGLVRIGATADVDKYLRKLAANYHERCTLLATMPGDQQGARELWRRFATHRTSAGGSGRFRPAPELLDFIQAATQRPVEGNGA
jgi:hypothetical protein